MDRRPHDRAGQDAQQNEVGKINERGGRADHRRENAGLRGVGKRSAEHAHRNHRNARIDKADEQIFRQIREGACGQPVHQRGEISRDEIPQEQLDRQCNHTACPAVKKERREHEDIAQPQLCAGEKQRGEEAFDQKGDEGERGKRRDPRDAPGGHPTPGEGTLFPVPSTTSR